MLATSLAEKKYVRKVRWRAGDNTIDVLPAAGIFRANASGKTNVLRVMNDMRSLVLQSFRASSPTGGVHRHAHVLSRKSSDAPTEFAIDIVIDGVRHEYGFTVDDQRVLSEWARYYPRVRATSIFTRMGDDVELGESERAKGNAVKALLRPNALFLSTAASANHPVLLPIYRWFEDNLLLAEVGSRSSRQALTAQLLDDKRFRSAVLQLLSAADLGITGVKKRALMPELKERLAQATKILTGREESTLDDERLMKTFEHMGMRLIHRGKDGDVDFDSDDESLGTQVWFGLVGPVVRALAEGVVLLADELDASLHPALVATLVGLFQTPEANPLGAQLVFNSHDATLLGDSVNERLLGRDQVWFTEKDRDGCTRLYSLADLDPRKGEAIARRYLSGRYGAVPIISGQQFTSVAAALAAGERD